MQSSSSQRTERACTARAASRSSARLLTAAAATCGVLLAASVGVVIPSSSSSPLHHNCLGIVSFAEAQSKDKAIGLPSHAIHHDAVPWIRCDVCVQMVDNAFTAVERLREEGPPPSSSSGSPTGSVSGSSASSDGGGGMGAAPLSAADKKLQKARRAAAIAEGSYVPPVLEEHVMEALETVCNPFSENGWWLRYWGIDVTRDRTEASLKALDDYMQCQGHCLTIADACQQVHDSPRLDKLSGLLYKGKVGRGELQSRLCRHECRERDALQTETRAALAAEQQQQQQQNSAAKGEGKDTKIGPGKGATKGKNNKKNKKSASAVPRLSKRIALEKHVRVDDKQLDVEEMIDRMGRTRSSGSPAMDVFSRDTITEMQAAMTHGTQEQAAMFDPQVADLSAEEFAMLQKMFQDEKGHEYPEAPDFEAAAIARGELPGSALGRAPATGMKGEEDPSLLDGVAVSDSKNGNRNKKSSSAQDRVAAAEAAIKAQIDKLSDDEVLALIAELEKEEKKRVGGNTDGDDSSSASASAGGATGNDDQGGSGSGGGGWASSFLDLLGLGGDDEAAHNQRRQRLRNSGGGRGSDAAAAAAAADDFHPTFFDDYEGEEREYEGPNAPRMAGGGEL